MLNGTDVVATNFFFLMQLKNVKLPAPNVTVTNVRKVGEKEMEISLFSETISPWTWISTP